MKFYQRKSFWLIFVLIYTVIFFRFAKSGIHAEGDVRGWQLGDTYSAKNVECAAHFYADSGFVKNYGLPSYGYGDTIAWNEFVYTHYPPMSEWIAGVFAIITGKWQADYLAIFPLLLSLLLFFIIFKFLDEFFDNKNIGFIGACFITLSPYFIGWADDIHQHLYNELLRWSFVYIWWLYLKFNRSHWYLLPLAIFYLCMCLISFEPYVFIAVVIVGFSWVLKRQWISWPIVLLLSVPFLAMAIRLLLNTLHIGSFEGMVKDMTEAFTLRTGGHSARSELGRCMNGYDYFVRLPWERFKRLGMFYLFPSTVMVLMGIFAFYKMKLQNKELFRLTLVLYIASLSWMIVMIQHALVHVFTTRHFGILVAMLSGCGIYHYYFLAKEHYKVKSRWLFFHVPIILYALGHMLYQTVYVVYLKFGVLYPYLGIFRHGG